MSKHRLNPPGAEFKRTLFMTFRIQPVLLRHQRNETPAEWAVTTSRGPSQPLTTTAELFSGRATL
jgi:hypothetical protein